MAKKKKKRLSAKEREKLKWRGLSSMGPKGITTSTEHFNPHFTKSNRRLPGSFESNS